LKGKFLKISSKVFCILLTTSLILVFLGSMSIQSTPPNEGDWVIKDGERVSHESITLNGNIIIKSGGELQLNYADLKFNSNKDFEYKIHIEDGGELEMRYSSINLNADYSIIIIVESDGNLKIYNSTIYDFSTIEQVTVEESVGIIDIMIILIVIIVIIIVTLMMLFKKNQEILQQLKGKIGVVENPVHPDNISGTVRIDSRIRSAKSKDDKIIESGEKVMVAEVEGSLLVVERIVDIVKEDKNGGSNT